MKILGIKVTRHDTGACILYNDKIVAISEERLNREKNTSKVPVLSIQYCMDHFNIKSIDEFDIIACDHLLDDDVKDIISKSEMPELLKKDFRTINHHNSHAASAFLCSPFEDAAIMIVDGVGSSYNNHLGLYGSEVATLYRGSKNSLTEIKKTIRIEDRVQTGSTSYYPPGLGRLYSETTRLVGFGKHQEGKTMGLASYGTNTILKQFTEEQFAIFNDGHVIVNPRKKLDSISITSKVLSIIRNQRNKDVLRFNLYDYFQDTPNPLYLEDYSDKDFQDKADLAFAVQTVLENMLIKLAKHLFDVTKCENLCVAGGVGLNSVANKKILDNSPFKNIWIQPAAGDTGIPLGAALYAKYILLKNSRNWIMKHAYLAREYSDKEIKNALPKDMKVKRSNDVAKETADLLVKQKIIGWFQGASEHGPRALGHRSILVDPRDSKMKDVLNARVKFREEFRPFAPAIPLDRADEYYDLNGSDSKFMLLVPQVLKNVAPATTHVDNSARVQTTTKEENGIYHDLILEFEKLTGVPIILNTSFNVAGEPIVETPIDAVKCFRGTDIDVLVIHDWIIEK